MLDRGAEAIVARPWAAMAVAFATGGLVALSRSRSPAVRAVTDVILAALIPVARELAARHVTDRARSWLDDARTTLH